MNSKDYKPFSDAEFESLKRMPVSKKEQPIASNFFGSNVASVDGDIKPVSNQDPTEYVVKHINKMGRLVSQYSDSVGEILLYGDQRLGTGFLIHHQVIMVSKHAIMEAVGIEGGLVEELVFSCPVSQQNIRIVGCLEDGAPTDDSTQGLDYVLLKLEKRLTAMPLPLVASSASDSDKQPFGSLWTLHYPVNTQDGLKLSIGESGGGEQLKLVADYAMDTSQCSSGAPIINAKGYVLGIHRGVVSLEGYRHGELLQTIYETHMTSVLISLSQKIDIDLEALIDVSPFMPALNDEEALEGFFHTKANQSKLYHVGRHLGSRSFVEIDKKKAKSLASKQVSAAAFAVPVDKHLVAEYNAAHPDAKMPLKKNKTQDLKLNEAYIDRCHRISADDIQRNICAAVNSKQTEKLKKFSKLLFQVDECPDAKGEYDKSIKMIDALMDFQKNKSWKKRTVQANLLYKQMFRAEYNLSFGHKSTNSSIGQKLDLNLAYQEKAKKYALTPRSRRIGEQAGLFKLAAPKTEGKLLYSSHIIDSAAPAKHNFKVPDKGMRTIKLEDIEKDSLDLIMKI